MDDPEPGSDEQVLARSQIVRIKSVLFEAVLTSKRIILADKSKDLHPTKNIPLKTIKDVKPGENASHEQVITITLLAKTGDTRQMILTFVRQTAGDPGREADEWVKSLKTYVTESASYPVDMAVGMQISGQSRQEHTGNSGEKKKTGIARPIKDQDGHQPSVSKSLETTSLPDGISCNRGGNSIPPGSTFCDVGDTKVVVPEQEMADSAAPGQIAAAPPATPEPGDHKGWTVEQIIHSTDPMHEDSVPRTETAPAEPEPVPVPPAVPSVETTSAADGIPSIVAEPVPAVPAVPQLPPVPAPPRKKHSRILAAAVIIIVIIAVTAGGFMVMKNLQKNTVVQPVMTPQPTTVTMVPIPTPTPVAVTLVTTTPVPQTTQVLIPQTGVWIEITYDKTYTGWVGTPDLRQDVNETGDHFYQIPTTYGTVAVSLQKMDGSDDELKVIVFSDGKTVKTVSTTTPSGIIDLQLSLATPTPTATPVLTPLPTLPLTSNATPVVNAPNGTLSIRVG